MYFMGMLDVAILEHRRVIDVAIAKALAHYLHERKIRCSILSLSLSLVSSVPDVLARLPDATQNVTPLAHIYLCFTLLDLS